MKFEKFKELFLSKYPEGEVYPHGHFGGTEKTKKVALVFKEDGKVYKYAGPYEDILCKVGIPVMSKTRFNEMKVQLEAYKKRNGCKGFFNDVLDYSNQIADLEATIERCEREYIIA